MLSATFNWLLKTGYNIYLRNTEQLSARKEIDAYINFEWKWRPYTNRFATINYKQITYEPRGILWRRVDMRKVAQIAYKLGYIVMNINSKNTANLACLFRFLVIEVTHRNLVQLPRFFIACISFTWLFDYYKMPNSKTMRYDHPDYTRGIIKINISTRAAICWKKRCNYKFRNYKRY